MNNYKTTPLSNVLDQFFVSSFSPFKIISGVELSTQVAEDIKYIKDNYLPKWVEELDEVGKAGEVIAFKYLKTKYKSVKWVGDNAFNGYDILADGKLFEIKTSKTSNSFFISQNELLTAHKNSKNHYLFFIKNPFKKPTGYIFSNIFSTFNLDFDQFILKSNIFENDDISIVSKDYRVNFESEYLDSLFPVDLSAFIEVI